MKKIKYILFFLLFVVFIGFTVYLLATVDNSNKNYFVSEVLIFKEDTEYEIIVNNKTNETGLRIGDVTEVYFTYPREGKYRYSIPNFNDITGENILENLKPVVDYTYNVSITDGYKYVKYLLDLGYSIEMYIASPQYIEFFLLKDSIYKRIVLFSDSLMTCDMLEGKELPKILDYLEAYNYNNKLVEKFEEIKNK